MNIVYVARCFALAAFLSSLAVLTPLAAAKSSNDVTIVTVLKLCPTCGKKIVQKLEQVPHVASASINVEQRFVQVTAKPGQILSPRQVWELIEEGGEQPVKLQGPSGTFTAKPQK